MSKLKIEHGVSKTERVKLQVSIDQGVASDIELMAKWSDNEKNYIVNELLRFAIGESIEFQRYKETAGRGTRVEPIIPGPKSAAVESGQNSRSNEVTR